MGRVIVAIDPGATTGWAVFSKQGKLTAASTHQGIPYIPLCLTGAEAVIEKPQKYPMSPADANNLITLAILVGEWKHYFENQHIDVDLVRPSTWKGSVPKRIHNQRVLRQLSEEESRVMAKRPRAKNFDHNMLDAVGLGLWKLGRKRR